MLSNFENGTFSKTILKKKNGRECTIEKFPLLFPCKFAVIMISNHPNEN